MSTPDFLGYNGDQSDQPSEVQRSHDSSLIFTHEGQSG